jgi:hypothetical protein
MARYLHFCSMSITGGILCFQPSKGSPIYPIFGGLRVRRLTSMLIVCPTRDRCFAKSLLPPTIGSPHRATDSLRTGWPQAPRARTSLQKTRKPEETKENRYATPSTVQQIEHSSIDQSRLLVMPAHMVATRPHRSAASMTSRRRREP